MVLEKVAEGEKEGNGMCNFVPFVIFMMGGQGRWPFLVGRDGRMNTACLLRGTDNGP